MAKTTKRLAKSIVVPISLSVIVAGLAGILEASAADMENEVVFPGTASGVPSIAVDGQNRPHVISYEAGNHDLLYACRNGGAWENETVDSEGRVGDGHDIIIDQEAIPWITYRDWDSGALKYARKMEGAWQKGVVDPSSATEVIPSSSLAIATNGCPHVAYATQSFNEPPRSRSGLVCQMGRFFMAHGRLRA